MTNSFDYNLREIKIEVSYKCNLNCIHCSSDASFNCLEGISEDVCFRLIDEAGAMGVEKISFSGGEPLLWKPLERAIERAKRYKIKIFIYSNGNYVNIKKRLKNFKNLGVDKCIFSLFGASAHVHQKVTCDPASFYNTIDAIKKSVAQDLPTEIHFVPLSLNYNELEALAKLGSELRVNQISVLRFVTQGRGGNISTQQLSIAENLKLKTTIGLLRSKNYKIRTGSPYNFLLLNHQPKCTAGIDKLTICPDLRIYPCDAFKQLTAEKMVGTSQYSDLSKNSLRDCWYKSIYLNEVRSYLNTSHEEPCLSCDSFNLCRSGCLAQKILYYGCLTKKPDPSCLSTDQPDNGQIASKTKI